MNVFFCFVHICRYVALVGTHTVDENGNSFDGFYVIHLPMECKCSKAISYSFLSIIGDFRQDLHLIFIRSIFS